MKDIRVSGKTVSDALTEALIQLGTTSDKVDYEVLEKGSAGFLGFGHKPAVIRVWKKEEQATQPANKTDVKEEMARELKADKKDLEQIVKKTPAEEPSSEIKKKPESVRPVKKETQKKTAERQPEEKAPSLSSSPAQEKEKKPASAGTDKRADAAPKFTPEEVEAAEQRIRLFLDDVFKAMKMTVEMTVRLDANTGVMSVNVEGNDMGILIGKRGQTLDSLQYLISLVANKESGEYIRVKLDTENYRRRRKATLENLAKNIAYKVKRDRKPVVLEPMNPYERRVIHSTLQNDRFVETHSEGVEPYRHIVVTLKKHI
ncbi:MAG: RNA-binding cell elongation regulator Jag/EloR [Lachnospiraceae bacterium]